MVLAPGPVLAFAVSDYANDNDSQYDEGNLFSVLVPVNFDGTFSATPFFMYGSNDTDSVLYNANGLKSVVADAGAVVCNVNYQHLYWAGSSFELTMLVPLTFSADVMWGMADTPGSDDLDRSGLFFDSKVAYKTPYVTPPLFGLIRHE